MHLSSKTRVLILPDGHGEYDYATQGLARFRVSDYTMGTLVKPGTVDGSWIVHIDLEEEKKDGSSTRQVCVFHYCHSLT